MKLTDDLILEFEKDDCIQFIDFGELYIKRKDANRLLREEMSKWQLVIGDSGHWRATPVKHKSDTAEDVLRDIAFKVNVSDDEWDAWKLRARRILEKK